MIDLKDNYVYLLTISIILISIYFFLGKKSSTVIAFTSSTHGVGKTQFIMSILGKKTRTFTTLKPETYKLGKFDIIDLPVNSREGNFEQEYFFYKAGDNIPKQFNGIIVVEKSEDADGIEKSKSIITKNGLRIMLSGQINRSI
eukprot:NODE_2_length_91304_cov_0.692462.p68 type:complete len:143 gc:universal NODE_2_length_91304_cov_0.692462:16890-17318(+)